MKSLKILTVAALSSLIALTSAADLSITGDGRFRVARAADDNARDYRMRLNFTGGTQNAGVSMRLRADNISSDANTESARVKVQRLRAFAKVGVASLSFGENDAYTGMLGTYYGRPTEWNNDSIDLAFGDPSSFMFVISNTQGSAPMKNDFNHLVAIANVQDISFVVVNRPSNLSKGDKLTGWGVEPFTDITVSGDFSGSSFELNNSKSDAKDADAFMARVSIPVSGLTLKAAYGKFEANWDNEDGGTLLGEGIMGDQKYGTSSLASKSRTATKDQIYTGLAVAGAMGNINYQLTAGSFDDANDATKNSFYDLKASYGLDSSTTLTFGLGEAGGEDGVGAAISYSF